MTASTTKCCENDASMHLNEQAIVIAFYENTIISIGKNNSLPSFQKQAQAELNQCNH